MKESNWRGTKRVEINFAADILRLLGVYFNPAEKAKVIDFEAWFLKYAWQASQRMVTGLLVHNSRTWRQAARESMKGGVFYQALQNEMRGSVGGRVRALVQQNASLISTLPYEIAEQVTRAIARRAQQGERAAPIGLLSGIARSRAQLIARTETSKATTALTQARSEYLGIQWYVWRTSEDQRVRKSHRLMEGVLINWTDPPSPEKLFHEKNPPAPYQAGNIYNCRCYPEPLMRLDQVSWPHRVYMGGVIRMMTLAKFKQTQPLAA